MIECECSAAWFYFHTGFNCAKCTDVNRVTGVDITGFFFTAKDT